MRSSNEALVLGGYRSPKELHDDQLTNEVLVVATLDVDSGSCRFLSTVGERDELGRFRAQPKHIEEFARQ